MQNQEEEQEQEMKWQAQIMDHLCGIVDSVVLKCAIDLNLFDIISSNNHPITLSSLATSPNLVSIKPHNLYRLVRYLVHMNLIAIDVVQGNETFSLTQLSKLLLSDQQRNIVDWALAIIDEPCIHGWHQLSDCCFSPAGMPTPFERIHGKSVWMLAGENDEVNQLINNAMECDTRLVMPAFVECCDNILNGIASILDVGGGGGMAMSYIVKSFPHIKCTTFDLPHVIAASTQFPGVEMVGGDMFERVPPADSILLKFMLHNWQDEECLKILKNCKEAIPKDKGKVIILDIVIDQDKDDDDDVKRAKMNLDIDMMVTSGGRERTAKEWGTLLDLAGFHRHEIVSIIAIQSIIIAYP
ncbi:Acetylserotonin o-methyltransferase [Thalictrum thalictroides]|uniref:Acetylserotonin o-methyltransferase n=1 Tax=Thalictrum thalictroides TaxID=46969 RepID=A0A7J6UZ02_THATH|nr:Acetylserotonin o-methyltransferase [Thalictrum thalictroides]